MELNTVLHAYLECALWSSSDDNGEPLDRLYSVDDISPETIDAARGDCADFLELVASEGVVYPGTAAQFGTDFWLTRNGHGAGFWDRGYGDVGERLTELAKVYGSVDLYVGDDGWIHHV